MLQRFQRVMPLALLHALTLQQSYYGRHAYVNHQFWTLADLANVVDVFQNLTAWTDDLAATTDLVAQVIVYQSDIRSQLFMHILCSFLSASLLDSS